MTPEAETAWIAISFGALLLLYWYLMSPNKCGEQRWRALRDHFIMSNDEPPGEGDLPVAETAATTATERNNAIATPQNDSNELLLRAKADALAAMIAAGKVTQTEGIKIVFGVSPSSSSPHYQQCRNLVRSRLDGTPASSALRPLTPAQAARRRELGLPVTRQVTGSDDDA